MQPSREQRAAVDVQMVVDMQGQVLATSDNSGTLNQAVYVFNDKYLGGEAYRGRLELNSSAKCRRAARRHFALLAETNRPR